MWVEKVAMMAANDTAIPEPAVDGKIAEPVKPAVVAVAAPEATATGEFSPPPELAEGE